MLTMLAILSLQKGWSSLDDFNSRNISLETWITRVWIYSLSFRSSVVIVAIRQAEVLLSLMGRSHREEKAQ